MANLIKGSIVQFDSERTAAIVGKVGQRSRVKLFESRFLEEYTSTTIPANVLLHATGKTVHNLPVLIYYNSAVVVLDS